MTIKTKAQAAADALLAGNGEYFEETWPVTVNGKATNNEVRVLIIKGTKGVRRPMTESIHRAHFFGSGNVCKACGGTGRE